MTRSNDRTEPALRLDDVTYAYPRSSGGVRHVSLSADTGTIYGLLGQNGAGKTTLMRLMLGLLMPASGRVLIGGVSLPAARTRLMKSIGSLVETPSLYLHLTGREHLRVFAAYYSLPASAANEALGRVGLADAGDKVVKRYSLGMKQRLGIATALINDPKLLVLDEPMNGLDPGGIADLRALLVTLADGGKTVIVSSHLLSEVEKSAARIGILHEGKLTFEGSPAELAARARSGAVTTLRVSNPGAAAGLLASAGWSCRADGNILLVDDVDDAQVGEIVRRLNEGGHEIFELRPRQASLEDDFLQFVGAARDVS